jgi:hypothetical protein
MPQLRRRAAPANAQVEDGYWLDTGRLNVFDGIIAAPARTRGAQPAVAPAGGRR